MMAVTALKLAVKDTGKLTVTGWAQIPSDRVPEAATGKPERKEAGGTDTLERGPRDIIKVYGRMRL